MQKILIVEAPGVDESANPSRAVPKRAELDQFSGKMPMVYMLLVLAKHFTSNA